jgi:hypothetical protein
LSDDEIEITPEMMSAGLAVFRDRDAFDVFSDETLERLIVEAYEAMRTAWYPASKD